MAALQFGYFFPLGRWAWHDATRATYPMAIDAVLERLAGAFDSVWMGDHLQFDLDDTLEAWTMISYLAGRAPTLRVGTMVLSQSFRNPALLAKMAATLQYASRGRLILGLGAGWKEDEHRAYGYAFPPNSERVTQLDEALRIIKALWREERATYAGRSYRVSDAACEPKPDPPPPILIGARQPRMVRLAARHADWWNLDWRGLAACRDTIALLDESCAAIRRDPATLRKTYLALVSCAPTEAAAHQALAGMTSFPPRTIENAIVGTPAQVIDQMHAYAALGIDYLIIHLPDFPGLATFDLLRERVLPAFQATS